MKNKKRFLEVLLNELKKREISRVFGVPGRESAEILFNEVEGIEYITTRVEFNAGIMADFTGRMTGRPQVCFSTMGPGATNMMTAIASARLNYSPTLFITAQLETDDCYYNLSHQCVDQVSMTTSLAKWSYELTSENELLEVLDKAFLIALEEPVGPVVLSIPVDLFRREILINETCEPYINKSFFKEIKIDGENIDAIYDQVKNAKYPICIIGQEAIRASSQEEIKTFCRIWNIPLITSANAKGLLSFEDPLNYGSLSPYIEGILGHRINVLHEIFSEIDLIICVGYQYVDDILPKMWNKGISKYLINISAFDHSSIKNKYAPDLSVRGNIKAVFNQLLLKAPMVKNIKGIDRVKSLYIERYEDDIESDQCLTPIQLVKTINNNLDDGFFITDVGFYKHYAILFALPESTEQFYTDAGLSSFGTGLGSAAAAQFLHPDKKVFLLCGDGGFHSTSCDLATIAKYNLPIIIILANNSSYELIHLYQKRNENKENKLVTSLSCVDFVKLAEANGCKGIKVNNQKELEGAIRGHTERIPLLIECSITYENSI